ncbi:hypothetical protein H3Z85_22255 [Chryseobacterium indologenes]|uniref:hypothetical protein n=1 Tax=Chryseobacterium TaxID=59732 RepID=UPI0003E06B2C|nr:MULTISPECIES: hypothetical protein [Chryseobacterium]MBF6643807.1 hypothetical protein [Chryseobacterium indologenes]MBU3048445.1 hypothetical protein [Chryseobacterium indologenes]MEB4762855.1 hypothetical protein [Chryseobacterium indologenes]QPQ51878.1 hypothetical protein H3Z85_22255 [Chryseobacterium indologenes]QQQ72462.1 hypothetical protein JHW31_06990 [Chryseobacterium indologenes]
MMKIRYCTLLLGMLCTHLFGQTSEKITFKDTRNHYLKLVPEGKAEGILVILPGGGENGEKVMNQINLDDLALEKNLIVLFPTWEDGDFGFHIEQKFLDRIVKDTVEKHKVSKDKISIGGLSGGGMLAVTYAERAVRDKNTYFIPNSVFAVDAPLDYENMYYRLQREIERNYSDIGTNEAKYLTAEMVDAMGTPDKNKANYLRESMFSYREKDGGNAKYLLNIPILIYTEPGIIWQMENRGRDIYDLNVADITAMINLLRLKGHKNADLVITNDRGIRPDGTRHPHSWSIMDSKECLLWILKHMKA